MLGFAHDWANRENARRSWDLVARYVIPAINGSRATDAGSADYVEANKAELIGGASAAVMSKIMAHEGAAAAMATTMAQMAERAAAARPRTTNPTTTRRSAPAPACPIPVGEVTRSVVLQRHGVGVTFIFGSYSATSTTRPSPRILGAQLGAARLARTVEPLVDGGATPRAGEPSVAIACRSPRPPSS